MFVAHHARSFIQSHLDWWALAGLDTLVDEEPRDWMAVAPAAVSIPEKVVRGPAAPSFVAALRSAEPVAAAAPMAQPTPLAMPDDWPSFRRWLEHEAAVPGTRWSSHRILPAGQAGSALMVLSLCPEMDDEASGELHSGAAGKLLDAMLRSIGLARADCYLASMAVTRPPGGRIDAGELAALEPMLWHHIGLVRPRRLLIFGADLARLLAGTDPAGARGRLLSINHDGTNMDAVAIQHPALLLDRPPRKAAAWDSLKLLVQG